MKLSPEKSILPLGLGPAIAELGATFVPFWALDSPFEKARVGTEGGSGTASLSSSGSKQTGVAACKQ